MKFSLGLILFTFFSLFPVPSNGQEKKGDSVLNFLFTSDAHYGLNRKKFRGDSSVPAYKVNKAMIQAMNCLPGMHFPDDGGLGSGTVMSTFEYIFQTGDIANRMEIPIQSAAQSWRQFKRDYGHGIHLKNQIGKPIHLLMVPGNHDISNAVGFAKPMNPLKDPTPMVQMYNTMLSPLQPLTNDHFSYPENKVHFSKNVAGIHFMFLNLWPDSTERIWMEKDLEGLAPNIPVLLFTHDQPAVEAKHFTNPVPPYIMTLENKFENLLPEKYKEGEKAKADGGNTRIEQKGLVQFLKKHPNIKAYFHGNSNWNEFYNYTGPDNDIQLPVFRVDSPLKGRFSSETESLLSFQILTLDPYHKQLTVRECLWNSEGSNGHPGIKFGESKTISLK